MTDTQPSGSPASSGPPGRPPGPSGRPSLGDGLRFALGTLTVVPVRVSRWDRAAARNGMVCAPLAGLLVGSAAAALGGALLVLGAGSLLAATAGMAAAAGLTRGLHLDGLADTADGLGSGGGSGRSAADALRIMKQSDIGPFGVITLCLVLLAQVAAVSGLYGAEGWPRGASAVVVAALTARSALTLACREGVAAARPEGLGAAVAGVVPRRTATTVCVVTALAAAATGALFGPYTAVHHALAVLAALGSAELLLRHCRRRLGGVTGDVLGAVAETAATTALVVLALGH